MKTIAKLVFKIIGWDIDKTSPKGLKKCVVVMGPHTSNWDFVLGKMAFLSYGVNANYLIKSAAFFFPFGYFLRRMGGIPVNRSQKNNLTAIATDLFKSSEELFLVFTPEGTRSYNPNWKKGFYYIAVEAKVPICIAYVDYKNKKGGFHSIFNPSGNVDNDIIKIKTVLSQFEGRFPEKGVHI